MLYLFILDNDVRTFAKPGLFFTAELRHSDRRNIFLILPLNNTNKTVRLAISVAAMSSNKLNLIFGWLFWSSVTRISTILITSCFRLLYIYLRLGYSYPIQSHSPIVVEAVVLDAGIGLFSVFAVVRIRSTNSEQAP